MGGRKSGLGRGLESLIPVERPDAGYSEIPLDRITPNPNQPRGKIDEDGLGGLAASIREVGVLQPVMVRSGENEGYVLIAGERRWRAAKLAALEQIPAIIREAGDTSSLLEALIENVQREDLTALEEAAAFQDLVEGSGLTHEEVGQRVGKSRAAVSNALRLLSLPAAIQGMLDRGELQAGAARALLGVEDEAFAQHIARRAVDEGWSVRQVEDAVRARQGGQVRRGRGAIRERPAAIVELEERLGEHLQTPVKIDYGRRGGKVIVRFKSLDDLERIYKQFYG